ncbi:hypothetical protein AMEX_G10019 [Astyanax mexicanus]|uniref:ODAD1 central coiled coil region domain-containing protein n=1 Tax=Astyanax mexicanus TaxID=7994 RepID=A0A8T2LTA3_ASTMX|nr:hypothetical protein AMEX_G10019 [Astyanax mexicanus]
MRLIWRRSMILFKAGREEARERRVVLKILTLMEPSPSTSWKSGEDLNFSLDNYISEQYRHIGQITRDVQKLRMRMEKEQERHSAEHHHLQDRLEQLQLGCQQATQAAETIEKAQEEKDSFLSLVKAVVESFASIAEKDISAFDLSSLLTNDSVLVPVLTLLGQIQPVVDQLEDILSHTKHEEKKDGKQDLKSKSKRPRSKKRHRKVQTSETRPSASSSMPSVDQVARPILKGSLPGSKKGYSEEELKPPSRKELQKARPIGKKN